MRFCLLFAAVLMFLPALTAAQESTGKSLVAPSYSGPPASIDGPQVLPAPSQPWLNSSGSVVMPEGTVVEGENAVPLDLPGDSALDGLPPDHILVAPPQKISAYKNSFFQKLSLAVDYLGNDGDRADLGITETEAYLQVGLPAPIKE